MNKENLEKLVKSVAKIGRRYANFEKREGEETRKMELVFMRCRVPMFNRECISARSRLCRTSAEARKMIEESLSCHVK